MTRRNSPSDPEAVAEALDRLSDELRVLRDVLDEILTELQWANRNCGTTEGPVGAVRRITSMPLDPTAPDWADRVNRFSAADVAGLPAEDDRPTSGDQGQLF